MVGPAVGRFFCLNRSTPAEQLCSVHDLMNRRTAAHDPHKPVRVVNPLAYRVVAKLCLGVCGYDHSGHPVKTQVPMPAEGSLGDLIRVGAIQEMIKAECRKIIGNGARPESSSTLRGMALLALSWVTLLALKEQFRGKFATEVALFDSLRGMFDSRIVPPGTLSERTASLTTELRIRATMPPERRTADTHYMTRIPPRVKEPQNIKSAGC